MAGLSSVLYRITVSLTVLMMAKKHLNTSETMNTI